MLKRNIVIAILLVAISVSSVAAIAQSDETPLIDEFAIQNKMLNVVKYPFNGNYANAAAAGLDQFQAGSMSPEAGKYRIAGKIAGPKFVSIKNNMSKFSKLIIEQGEADKKILTVGESWDIGGGWTITAVAIDAKADPRQVWFVLNNNGQKLDDKVVTKGQIYTYVAKSFAGETDVPMFVTYVDSIFPGATSDFVQIRYTWALGTNPIIIR